MFITGCHRSGTSLLASVLSEFTGVVPDPSDQMQPALDNPMGFLESNRLVSFNDSLLERMGCSWVRPPLLPLQWDQDPLLAVLIHERQHLRDLALEQLWLAKDPRLCLTYPAYVHVMLRRVPIIAAIRDPLAVAGSLFARNGLPINAGLCLWFIYNHHLSSAIATDEPVIAYSRLLKARGDDRLSSEIFERVSLWLQRNGIQSGDYSLWCTVVERLLRPSLDRAGAVLAPSVLSRVSNTLLDTCVSAYSSCLENGADGFALQKSFGALPRVILEMQQLYGVCTTVNCTELARLREIVDISHQQRRELEVSLKHLQSEYHAIKASTSWRITSPFRFLVRQISN